MLTYGAYLCSKYHLYSYFKVWSECFMGTKWEQTTIQADFTFHTFFLHLVCLAETKQAPKVSTKLDFNGTNNPWNMQLYLNIKSLLSTFNTFIWIWGIMVSSQSTTCSLSKALWHHCLGWWDYSPNKAAHSVWSVPHQVVWWLQCCRLSSWVIISCLSTPF